MNFIPITEGAGQDILDALDTAVSVLTDEYSVTSGEHNEREWLTEATGRNIAAKLVELANALNTYKTDTAKDISDEKSAREDADDTLTDALKAEIQDRTDADDALQGNLDAEAETREGADNTLQGNIESEATAREKADTAIQDQIDGTDEDGNLNDGTIQKQIDDINTHIDNTDTTGDTTSIQSQINGIKADYVTTDTEQKITAAKTFSETITANGGVKGNLTGNATTATSLQIASNIQTNLASEEAVSFDGSESAYYPGVTGTLPVSNGGTGNETGTAASVEHSFTVQGTAFDGSEAKTVEFTGTSPIEVSGTTISHATTSIFDNLDDGIVSNVTSISAGPSDTSTLSFGDSVNVPRVTADKYGHISVLKGYAQTLPSLTLNGSPAGDSASFYAPTSYGDEGEVLVAQGKNNAPQWSSFSVGYTTGSWELYYMARTALYDDSHDWDYVTAYGGTLSVGNMYLHYVKIPSTIDTYHSVLAVGDAYLAIKDITTVAAWGTPLVESFVDYSSGSSLSLSNTALGSIGAMICNSSYWNSSSTTSKPAKYASAVTGANTGFPMWLWDNGRYIQAGTQLFWISTTA